MLSLRLGVLGLVFMATAFADEPVLISAQRTCDSCTEPSASPAGVNPDAPAATQSLESVINTIANLHMDAGGAGSFGNELSYRGLSNTPYFSDPAVTVYVDDIPLAGSFTVPTRLIGVDSATFWRGSTASQFGRGGEAGTLILSSGSLSNEARVGVGNHDTRVGELIIHSESDTLDGRLAAAVGARDGYIRNTLLHEYVDDQRTADFSGRLRWSATDTAQFTLQALATRERDGAQPLVPLGGPLFTVTQTRDGSTDIDTGGLSFKGAFVTPVGVLTSTTSRTTFSLDPYDNRLVLPPTLDSRLVQSQHAWNEELELAPRSPMNAFSWQLGAWLSSVRTQGGANRAIVNLFPIEVSSFGLRSREAALFGRISYRVAGGWMINAGLRFEQLDKDFNRANYLTSQSLTGTRVNHFGLPELSLRYDWTRYISSTLTISGAARPGGWSAYTDRPALAPFAPEHATQLEFLTQALSPVRHLALAVRAFAYLIHDLQIERSFNAQDYLVVNAARARSVGEELDLTWDPIAPLHLTASFGATQATLEDYHDPFTQASYTGNPLPYVPAFTADFRARYQHAGWFVSPEVTSGGRRYFDESSNPRFAQGSYVTLNTFAGYSAGRWRLSAYADNVTNRGYYTLIVPGIGHAAPAAPRLFGLEVAATLE